MRKVLAVMTIFCAATCFAGQAKKSKKTTAPAATEASAVTIPKSAVLGDDGSYRYTDKQGKKWLYRSTPFGVSKVADEGPKPAAQQPTGPELTKATVVGDTVKFERPSAFGITHWEKKTSELTDDEKKIVENQKAKQE